MRVSSKAAHAPVHIIKVRPNDASLYIKSKRHATRCVAMSCGAISVKRLAVTLLAFEYNRFTIRVFHCFNNTKQRKRRGELTELFANDSGKPYYLVIVRKLNVNKKIHSDCNSVRSTCSILGYYVLPLQINGFPHTAIYTRVTLYSLHAC